MLAFFARWTMAHLTLDEAMERGRRAKLHKQIAAIDKVLYEMGDPKTPWGQRKFYKLLAKKTRLQKQLDQGVFGLVA